MFESLRNAISSSGDKKAGYKSEFILDNPQQIAPLLKQIHKARTLLNTSFKGSKNSYGTAILGIYIEHGFLVLDELTPKSGHKHLLEEREILVRCRQDGVDVAFKTTLVEAREKDGVAFYKVAIPQVMRYVQRRQDHRVATRGENIPFHAYSEKSGSQPLRGQLFDLSRNGLGVTLQESITLNPGDILTNCTINLPGGGKALCSLEVRYFGRSKTSKTARLGGLFTEIDQESRQKISHAISLLEREEAKRLSRL